MTSEQRQIALDTVANVILRVDDLMKNDVKLSALRVEIIRRMLDDVQKIRDHALKNPLEDRTEAMAFTRIGDIYFEANRVQDAESCYEKAYQLLAALVKAHPEDANNLRNLAAACSKYGEIEFRLGHGPKARGLFADTLRLRQERARLVAGGDEMARADAAFDLADAYNVLAFHELRENEHAAALEHYLAADKAYADLPPPLPNFLKTRRSRCEIWVRIGDAQWHLGKMDEAEAQFRKALAAREELQKLATRPESTVKLLKVDVGQSLMYLGDFFQEGRKDRTAAAAEYTRTLGVFDPLLKADPRNLDLMERVAATHFRLGITAPTPEKAREAYLESLKIREELAKIDSQDLHATIQLAEVLGKLGARPRSRPWPGACVTPAPATAVSVSSWSRP